LLVRQSHGVAADRQAVIVRHGADGTADMLP
jgi:hypothetical protein